MKTKLLLGALLLFLGFQGRAQVTDSVRVEVDSVEVDTATIVLPENGLKNPNGILSFFQKLYILDRNDPMVKGRKINIVHIGDSHIQADLLTNKVRKDLQKVFGNGGRGLVFPHSLARTNGSSDIRFSSNTGWQSRRNISPPDGSPVGLSGIALYTNSDDFAIELNTKEIGNEFNTIKLVTPKNRNSFGLATAKRTITLESTVPKKIVHKIKNGEAISVIADQYNVSIAAIKKLNRLKSDKIRAGRTLKIPTSEMQPRSVKRSEFIPLELLSDADTHFYQTDNSLDKIYLLPNKGEKSFALNGVVLENKNSGVLYHNIGVNGAKFSDYNKYPLFFEQLKALQPDLVIVSLGTNESFDKMRGEDYMAQLDLFLQNVKAQNPGAAILVVTPPPSLFQRKYPNIFAADYAQKILNAAEIKGYAVWDLYSQFGGLYGVNRNFRKGLMANDRVHYSKAGYEQQGDLLSEALLKAFQTYKTNKD